MLTLKNVQKRYGAFALDCSLSVPSGCVTGLIGRNGAGKSTTFKALLGLISVDAGEIEIFGKKNTALTPKEKGQIGVVLSDSGFSDYLVAKDICAVLGSMYPGFDREKFRRDCGHFQIPWDKKLKEFSTGMKAKLKLLVALSHSAKLLVLDEPTAGLDVVVRDEFLSILQEYMDRQDDCAVLISSHISGDLEKFCDDVYMIDEGQIVLHEETDLLLGSYGLIKADEKQCAALDGRYLVRRKKAGYGYSLLTNQRQFYMENYPEITVEKIGIDNIILMMTQGEEL